MKLVVHLGAGKTGSSSIQHTLRANASALAAQQARYLGMLFEHGPVQAEPWQKAAASEVFHALPPAEASAAMGALLDRTVAAADRLGLRTLLWSNESLYARHQTLLPGLRQLISAGVDVQLLAYVRHPVDWARSAYVQWGLKHKTAPGALPTFAQWAATRRPSLAAPLHALRDEFGERLLLRNYDRIADVVPDFLAACGLDGAGFVHERANDSPPPHELLLRAQFNSRLRGPALPARFDRLLGAFAAQGRTPQAQLDHWLPDDAALAALAAPLQPECAQLDALLRDSGQPPLADTPAPAPAARVDNERLLMALCEIVLAQAQRIDRLERQAGAPSAADGD